MIKTYNYPGSSTFCYVYFQNSKKGIEAASEWWLKVHYSLGPCAPGGRMTLSDKEAKKLKYRDGSKVISEFVETVDGKTIKFRSENW